MRDRCDVFDHADLKTRRLQRTDCSFTAGARALDIDLDALHAVLHGDLRRGFRCGLRRERRGLSGAAEAELACACPGNCVALCICDGYDRVVEGGLDMCSAALDVLALTASADCGNCFSSAFGCCDLRIPPDYFFLLAMVFLGPLRVLALVFVRWPLTGRPLRWRTPR